MSLKIEFISLLQSSVLFIKYCCKVFSASTAFCLLMTSACISGCSCSDSSVGSLGSKANGLKEKSLFVKECDDYH